MTIAPSIEERAKKAKTSRKAQGASGRLHRTEAGDWVWSSSDEEDDSSGSSNHNNHNSSSKPEAVTSQANCHNVNNTLTNDSTLVQNRGDFIFLFFSVLEN